MFRFSSPFVLDLRSIALFRICYGSVMLYDLMSRLPYVGLFLSDDGALSRDDLLETIDRPWSFSLYLMLGESSQVTALMLVHAVAALAVVVGFWTRWASVACWILVLSLQHRNPLVLNGGDTLLSVYAFWAMFLPLNARWSLDRALRKAEETWPAENRFHAVPGAAILLQTVFLYVFTVLLKSGELWKSGEAVAYVLRNASLIKGGAVWLLQFEQWHGFLSKLTYHWEWFGCVLLLCPFANGATRLAAVAGYTLMQLGFLFSLDLALFPLVSIMGVWVLLPGVFWDWFELRLGPRLGKAGVAWRSAMAGLRLRGGRQMRPGRLAALVTGVSLIAVLFWNLRGLPDSPLRERTPDALKNALYAVKLRQKWGMFAANPPRSSTWYTIEARLANGDSLDLFNPGVPYTLRRPEIFSDRLPDRRWTKFISNMRKSKYSRLRDDFLEYFVERWNAKAGASNKIHQVKLVYFRERINPGSDYGKPSIRVLETLFAEDVRQIKKEPSSDEESATADDGEDAVAPEDEEGDDL